MLKFLLAAVVLFSAAAAKAHEWTPTYPKFNPSYVEGVSVTTMKIFNKRNDASFYKISLYDEEWNEIPFASESRVVEVEYLEQKSLNIYILEQDCDRLEYICSKSMLQVGKVDSSGVNTRICSRF